MKKLLISLALITGLCAPAGASDLSDKMLQLFKDKNRNISLGAMLIADMVGDNAELINYVRWSLKKSDPPVDALVKRYYLARTASEPAEILPFIKAFPENPDIFKEALAFDASLTRTVSGVMVMHLVDLAGCHYPRNVREAARDKISRLGMIQLLSGWSAEVFPHEEFPECRGR